MLQSPAGCMGAQHASSARQQHRRRQGHASALTAPGSQYQELAANLRALGHEAADILPTQTLDWLPTLAGGSFKFYLARLAEAVAALQQRHGSSQVCLVGVSAGGWLARLALSSIPYDGEVWGLSPAVHTLVTCGTPHQSLEAYPFGRAAEGWLQALPDAPPGVLTSLQYVNHHLPHADDVRPTRLVCVAGSAVRGAPLTTPQLLRRVLAGEMRLGEANALSFIATSYEANCGRRDVDGDGVCPVETAVVPGAEVLVLPGVWHNAEPGKLWYGSWQVVEVWDKHLP